MVWSLSILIFLLGTCLVSAIEDIPVVVPKQPSLIQQIIPYLFLVIGTSIMIFMLVIVIKSSLKKKKSNKAIWIGALIGLSYSLISFFFIHIYSIDGTPLEFLMPIIIPFSIL